MPDVMTPLWLAEPVDGPAAATAAAAPASPPAPRHLLLDDRALLTLELVEAEAGPGPGGEAQGGCAAGSLLQLLDRTASPAGRRRVRDWICRCVPSRTQTLLLLVECDTTTWILDHQRLRRLRQRMRHTRVPYLGSTEVEVRMCMCCDTSSSGSVPCSAGSRSPGEGRGN